ncbi:hypothetical protein PTKIN_Ptkin19aG0026900 [Pterospermum kingtungense]
MNKSTMSSGSATTRTFEFGRAHVVRPKGNHQATIVWLHGLGDKGSRLLSPFVVYALQLISAFRKSSPSKCKMEQSFQITQRLIKWICPTAPTRPVAIFGGYPCTAFKLEIDGFSMGAASALHSATCHILGKYGNGNLYPVNLSAIVGLSGWLPCSRTLRNQMEGSIQAIRRAASLPILLCHGLGNQNSSGNF